MQAINRATGKAIDDICKLHHSPTHSLCIERANQAFDVENQVRTIVADMLLNLSEKMSLIHRDLKGQQQEMQSVNIKIHETNTKLDREAKIKD